MAEPCSPAEGDRVAAERALSRCGFIAIIGAPNAGKSALVNALVGSKVSIVTRKPQTTRSMIRGIAIEGLSQLVLVDTPGIFVPRRTLDRAMVKSAWTGAQDADLIALVVDAARGLDEETRGILEKLGQLAPPKLLILNKVDLVKAKADLLALARELNSSVAFEQTYMISALTGDGISDLKGGLAARVPQGPWHYPEDQVSDLPLRRLAAEITREKLYLRFHQELPYRTTVETDVWKAVGDGSVRIEQTIFVERESQRKILLGERGRAIKAIGVEARREIADAIDATVHLFLFVKIRESWADDPERYREMGLEFPGRRP